MKQCIICGSTFMLEEHHLLPGRNRKNSEKYGLKVYVCHDHHTAAPDAIHRDPAVMQHYKQLGQQIFESKQGTRAEFIRIFGRNYLD